MAGVFAKIHQRLSSAGVKGRAEKSREWFLKNLKNMRNLSRGQLLTDSMLTPTKKPKIGRMFMFFYDPKGKETLPYYDKFPLVIMVEPTKNGFYGLNLHYLPPRMRAVFFDELIDRTNNTKFDETTRFRLTYDLLRGSRKLRAFQPCFKHYLLDHIASRVVEVPPTEWEIALFIPSDDFVGMNRQQIWKESRETAYSV
jgi:hypothetical protein